MRTCKRQKEEEKDRCGLEKHSLGYQEMFTSFQVYLEW